MNDYKDGFFVKVDARNEEIFICDQVYFNIQQRNFQQGTSQPSFAFGSKRFIHSEELDELIRKATI